MRGIAQLRVAQAGPHWLWGGSASNSFASHLWFECCSLLPVETGLRPTKLIKLQLPLISHLLRNPNPSPSCNPPLPPRIQISVRYFIRATGGSLWAISHSQPLAMLLGLTEFSPSCLSASPAPLCQQQGWFLFVFCFAQPCCHCTLAALPGLCHLGWDGMGWGGQDWWGRSGTEPWPPAISRPDCPLSPSLITGIIGFLY